MANLASIAILTHNTDKMKAFYEEAFGFEFEAVDTSGFKSYFGKSAGLTLKLVPLRKEVDFEGFPSHQPGFLVEDLDKVIACAEKHGGKAFGQIHETETSRHGAVRDPDGNTIELYQQNAQ